MLYNLGCNINFSRFKLCKYELKFNACWLCMTKHTLTAGSFNFCQTFFGLFVSSFNLSFSCLLSGYISSPLRIFVILVDCRRRICLIEVGVFYFLKSHVIVHKKSSVRGNSCLKKFKVKNPNPFCMLLWVFFSHNRNSHA